MSKNSPEVLVVDDSSSSSSDEEEGTAAVSRHPNQPLKTAATFQSTTTTATATATKQPAYKKDARTLLSWHDSSDEEEEELEVMAPCVKRSPDTKNQEIGIRKNTRPRLSSTGSSQTDPVNLLLNSPSSPENVTLKERLAKRRKQQQQQQQQQQSTCSTTTTTINKENNRSNTTTQAGTHRVPDRERFGEAASVSLSVASSSPSSSLPSTPETVKAKPNNKKSDDKMIQSKKQLTYQTNTRTLGDSDSSDDSVLFHNPFGLTKPGSNTFSKEKTGDGSVPRLPESSRALDSDDDTDEEDGKPKAKPRPAFKSTQSASRYDLNSSDSSDSDRSMTRKKKSTSTKQTNLARKPKKKTTTNPYAKEQLLAEKEEKKRQREETRAAKQREKDQAKELRERERRERKEAAEREKLQRKRDREAIGQARGKFAHQEVAVLVEPLLLQHETFNISESFDEQGDFQLHAYPSALSCMAVQWVRRDYLRGGAEQALKDVHARRMEEFEQFNTLTVVFDSPHDFISLIEQDDNSSLNDRRQIDDDDDDYPKLEEWLLGLVAGWRAAWKKTNADRPRIYLILYQVQKALDKAWINFNRSRGGRARGPPPPNAEQLHDAILWMLIQFQIEVVHCERKEDVGKELAKMTRFMAKSRYEAQTTELACIAKIKSQVSDMAPTYDRAVDCWIRQLRQIPRVSAEMAICFSRHYPTAGSLWRAYQNPNLTMEEKQVLVADCFGTRSCQVKLSRWMYRIFSSQNPEELLT